MERSTKSERQMLSPNSDYAAKQWKYWLRICENYVSASTRARESVAANDRAAAEDKLQILVNCIDCKVYAFIVDCNIYETTVARLRESYEKTPIQKFARNLLAAAKQQADQTLIEFLHYLQSKQRLWVPCCCC